MKPEAERRASVRGGALFDRVDYRLIETPEEKDQLYQMRYRAYTHGGLIPASDSQRYSDSYDDAPNAWTFGVYVDGELCSSIRLHLLTSEQRMSCTTDLFGDVLHPRLDRGEVFIDPARCRECPAFIIFPAYGGHELIQHPVSRAYVVGNEGIGR